jgi:hypothetical protein
MNAAYHALKQWDELHPADTEAAEFGRLEIHEIAERRPESTVAYLLVRAGLRSRGKLDRATIGLPEGIAARPSGTTSPEWDEFFLSLTIHEQEDVGLVLHLACPTNPDGSKRGPARYAKTLRRVLTRLKSSTVWPKLQTYFGELLCTGPSPSSATVATAKTNVAACGPKSQVGSTLEPSAST